MLLILKFSEFNKTDFEVDRFGWVKAARKFFSISSDEDLLTELKGRWKESYGDAWIDKKKEVLVLGPAQDQTIEVSDNYL